jgi:hypothetical protein
MYKQRFAACIQTTQNYTKHESYNLKGRKNFTRNFGVNGRMILKLYCVNTVKNLGFHTR